MRKYSSNLAFVDLLFNLLVGFTCLFVIAFLLINPISKTGTIDPPVRLMVEALWPDDSVVDIDLYVKGPDGTPVYYGNKDNGYITLKKDDLGPSSDRSFVDGEWTVILRNYEITTATSLPDGDYIINVHNFSLGKGKEEVTVRVTNLAHFDIVVDRTVVIDSRQEKTIVVFTVKDNRVVSQNTDLQVDMRLAKGNTP